MASTQLLKGRPVAAPVPQQERSRETQRRILTAARDLLAAGGWDALTVGRVATAAGVSVGSVYDRFVDKDGLIAAVQAQVLDEVDANLRSAFGRLGDDASTPVVDLVPAVMDALLVSVGPNATVLGPFLLRAASDPALRRRGEETSELAEELFTAVLLARVDDLTCSCPGTAVPLAFRVVFSAVMWRVMFGAHAGFRHRVSAPDLAHELVTLCQAYLCQPGAGPSPGG